jgi:hypothetical protein
LGRIRTENRWQFGACSGRISDIRIIAGGLALMGLTVGYSEQKKEKQKKPRKAWIANVIPAAFMFIRAPGL